MSQTAGTTGFKPAVQSSLHKRARRILTGKAVFADRFIADHTEAVELIELLRSMDCKIGFTTGVWDMFHVGHGDYIEAGKVAIAKQYPDAEHVIMVVGIDSDEVVQKRKGPTRPVVPMDERCKVLGHVRSADVIVPQTEENQLFRLLPYDARVISTSTKDLPNEAEIRGYCDYLVNLPPQAETSTTARIRKLALEGRLEALQRVKEGLLKLVEEIGNET